MLYPSIDLLITKLDSKYTLVTVAAKRARQLQVKK
nr:DNA-directed RNA polymerase subunit omega [Anoxybacillus sp. KU2-6(11)]